MEYSNKVFIMFMFFIFCGTSSYGFSEESDKQVMRMFDKELQNRAFALLTIDGLSQSVTGEDKQYWIAYRDFEIRNKAIYAPMAKKYGLSQGAGGMARFKAWWGVRLTKLMPSTSLSSIKRATEAYVDKLEELKAIAPKEEKTFFQFIVDQEVVQAEAMALLQQGDVEGAAKMYNDFEVNNSDLYSVDL